MSKPRLPKVWVLVRDGKARYMTPSKKEASDCRFKTETLHEYAPVQKPKRCVWSDHHTYGWMENDGCTGGEIIEGGSFKFCPNCGGKIRRAK